MIPGNDDATRAISLYCALAARAALDGMTAQLGAAGLDLGEMDEMVEEIVLEKGEAVGGEATEVIAEETPAEA